MRMIFVPRSRRRVSRTAFVIGAAVVLSLLLGGGNSSFASVTCTYDAADDEVLVNATGTESVHILRTASGAILVNAELCDPVGATVQNIDTITVTGDSGAQTIQVDLLNGQFAPGATAEGIGSAEIEFDINAGGGNDTLEILGSNASGLPTDGDNITAGTAGINPNASATDTDADISASGIEQVGVNTRAGTDTFNGAGGGGLGGAFDLPLVLNGGLGTDTLTGGDEDDRFDQGAAEDGGDTMAGGAGSDTVDYSARANSICVLTGTDDDGEDESQACLEDLGSPAPEGDDVGDDIEVVVGGSNTDFLNVASSPGVARGGPGGDSLVGGADNDDLFGEADNDSLSGGGGDDELFGGLGNDNLMNGGAGADEIFGQDGDDTIRGGADNDEMDGGPGNDTFQEQDNAGRGGGSDKVIGGAGIDFVDYCGRLAAASVTVTLGDNTANDGAGGESDNIGAVPGGDVENVRGGHAGDNLFGNALDNTLTGGAPMPCLGTGGADQAVMGTGADLITGGGGKDTINGDDGGDTLVGDDADDTINAGSGDDQVFGKLGNDTLNGDAGLDGIFGEDGDDILNGGDAVDELFGGNGNDQLTGGAGNDTEGGGVGNDTFNKGSMADGNDNMTGGTGTDTVNYSLRSLPVTVTLADNTANDGEVTETDNAGAAAGGDIENASGGGQDDDLTGNDLANTLSGGAGVDTLTGGLGADILNGGPGVDDLVGGDGDDVLNGGAGGDTENGGMGNDTFFQEQAANGGDAMTGAEGTDTVDYSLRTNPVTVTMEGTANDGEAGEGDNVGQTVEIVLPPVAFLFPWYDGTHNAVDWVVVVNTGLNPITAQIRIDAPEVGSPVNVSQTIAPGDTWTPQFPGVRGGPVRVFAPSPSVASIRSLWGSGAVENFEEVTGVRPNALALNHYWSWYDGVSTQGRDWVHVVNPGAAAATISLRVGGTEVANAIVDPGANWNYNNANLIGGPVVVASNLPVMASQRVLWEGVNFSETRGTALTTSTFFTWYDYPGSDGKDWIVAGNPSNAAIDVTIRIGAGQPQTISVPANSAIFPTFPGVVGGPVRVTATAPVVVSQRAIWGGISMEEVVGTNPSTQGVFSFYDSVSTGGREWILVANVGGGAAQVTIKIGGQQVHQETLAAGAIITPTFAGKQDGPVEVIGPGGSSLIISRRTLWGPRADFTEVLPF